MATQGLHTGSKSRAWGSSDELAVIAQRAQAFTNASGAAIALSNGSASEIICRARSGSSAPDVGAIMRVEGAFTGLCIQSGKELRCDDADTDTRVDTAGMRALGIRSMVVTPIKEEDRVLGVLVVFASAAYAFSITHVAVLKTVAEQISSLLQQERRAREEGVPLPPEPVRPSTPVTMAKPVAAVPAPVLPPAVVIKPAASLAATALATVPVVSKVEPIKIAPIGEEVIAPTPFPKRDERPKREERRAEHRQEHRASVGALYTVAGGEKKSNSRLILIGMLSVVAITAVSTFAYLKMRNPLAQSAAAPQHAQEATNPSATQPAAPGLVAANNTQPSSPTAGDAAASTSAPDPAPSNDASAKPSVTSNAADSAKKPVDKTPVKNNTPAPAPAEKRTPETVALSTGTSKIISTDNTGQQSSDAAPVLTVSGAAAPGALSVLAKPVSSSTPSVISRPHLEPVAMPAASQQGQLRKVMASMPPQYPELARKMNVQGVARVAGRPADHH